MARIPETKQDVLVCVSDLYAWRGADWRSLVTTAALRVCNRVRGTNLDGRVSDNRQLPKLLEMPTLPQTVLSQMVVPEFFGREMCAL
jgi:hypothetical protein